MSRRHRHQLGGSSGYLPPPSPVDGCAVLALDGSIVIDMAGSVVTWDCTYVPPVYNEWAVVSLAGDEVMTLEGEQVVWSALALPPPSGAPQFAVLDGSGAFLVDEDGEPLTWN